MSINGGPASAQQGLVFCFDPTSPRSYLGEPTTNIIGTWSPGNETKNTFPSDGNSWGSYHVELYNGAAYFAITASAGAAPVVTNNVVTCSIGHLFKTYSVVRPLTTGGGVTAGTNYFIKRMDSASFTVHTYDSTPNIGFNAHTNLATPLSINSTNFPTLWWGPAHVENSTHVKEIVSGGFNGHNCLRVHHFRMSDIQASSGSAQHGMAYGVTPTLTTGNTYTFSFYYRAVTTNAVGKQINWQRYTSPTDNYSTNIPALTTNWQRYSHTMTATSTGGTYQYWLWSADGAITSDLTFDLAELQIEPVGHPTKFTPYNRSLSSSVYDRVGETSLMLVNTAPFFDSSSNVAFTASTYISGGASTAYQPANVTVEAVVQYVGASQANAFIGGFGNTGVQGYWLGVGTTGTNIIFSAGTGTGVQGYQLAYTTSTPYAVQHIVGSYSASQQYLYVNGAKVASDSRISGSLSYAGLTNGLCIGNVESLNAARYWSGSIYLFKVYNRQLTDAEVYQNYNALRSRFGI